jgi:hypothetical protein
LSMCTIQTGGLPGTVQAHPELWQIVLVNVSARIQVGVGP